ncbi:TPR-1 domain protein [Rhizoctonia solani]|uniref:TPR-1 domain protein n=1 Tax=Rhizoctonia solani TaxID=456999 RepID=A0A8H8NNJ6_9AGAM|nr:TPR-1 domain protein [Rhizoctonia solani]QRW15636.1 TPR-1 domain protein [Rhizoctonia solani]
MSGGARFSFMDDNEEAPESPVPGSFPSSFPLPSPASSSIPGSFPSPLPSPTPSLAPATPSRGAPRSETPSISDVLVDENGSDASVADPNSGNATQDIPTDVVPILPPEGSADNPQPASAVSTPGIEEVSVVTHNSETPIREETPILEPETPVHDMTPGATDTRTPTPPIPIHFLQDLRPLENRAPSRSSRIHLPDLAEMLPEERAAITANEFLSSGDLEAAHQAITDLKELLSQGSNLPLSTKAQAAETLGAVLSQRFEHYGDVDDMEEAVEAQLKLASFSLESPDPELRIKSHGGLGRTLAAQFEHTADPDYAEYWLTLPASNLPSMHVPTMHGRSESLEQALARCEEALDSVPTNAPERTPLSGLLGGALLSRFDRTHSAEDVTRAVEFLGFAVEHTPEESPERPKRMRSYGDAIMMRAMVQNDMNSLNTAINIQEMALRLLTTEHAAYPATTGSLAKAFHIRYRATGDIHDLDKAIDYLKVTVEYTPFTDPDHARITDLLGKSFMAKYRTAVQPPRTQYLNYAVELHRQAVALTPSDHRRYAGRLESLGKAYSKRYRSQLRRQNAQQSDLDAAERCLREVIERDPSRIEDMLRELGNLGLH